MTTVLVLLLFLLPQASTSPAPPIGEYNIPVAVDSCLKGKALNGEYELSGYLNPFYLRADFDGDSKIDYAVLVKAKQSKKPGFVVCWGNGRAPSIIAAGKQFKWGDEFDFEGWRVYEKATVEQGVGEGKPPLLKGNAIEINVSESASGLIYWNGMKLAWYQQGD